MKTLKIMLVCMITYAQAMAQQEPMISHYLFNAFFLNPAYTGTHPNTEVSVLHRNQWTGFNGAPKTSVFSADIPLNVFNMGTGLMFTCDKLGATKATSLDWNNSYRIRAGKGYLSFGLKTGIRNITLLSDQIRTETENDPVFMNNNFSGVLAQAGTGLYYYTNRSFAGLSIPVLLAYDQDRNFAFDSEKSAGLRKHYYLQAGHVIDLNENLMLKPSLLLKYVNASPVQADMSLNFLIDQAVWVGASYRTKESFSAVVEYVAGKKLRVGYAFDYNTTEIRSYSYGSHEIMVTYEFVPDHVKIKTPRFF